MIVDLCLYDLLIFKSQVSIASLSLPSPQKKEKKIKNVIYFCAQRENSLLYFETKFLEAR